LISIKYLLHVENVYSEKFTKSCALNVVSLTTTFTAPSNDERCITYNFIHRRY